MTPPAEDSKVVQTLRWFVRLWNDQPAYREQAGCEGEGEPVMITDSNADEEGRMQDGKR